MGKQKIPQLRLMRIEAGFISANDAGAAFGVSGNTWLAWERRQRFCPPERWFSIATGLSKRTGQPLASTFNRLRDAVVPPMDEGRDA